MGMVGTGRRGPWSLRLLSKSASNPGKIKVIAYVVFVLFSAVVHLHLFAAHTRQAPTSASISQRYRRDATITDFASVSKDEPDPTPDIPCSPIPYDLTISQACQHIKDHCAQDDDKALARYLSFYYCADEVNQHPGLPPGSEPPKAHSHGTRMLRLLLLIAWLGFLFSSVGIVASDFFCPNLSTLAFRLGMSDSTAGVTLLSFGNSSPDIFSTYSAMKSGSGALAIGELIGAASFIVSVVAGSVMMITDFQVRPFPFCRDVGFFALALTVVLAFLVDGELHLGESLILIGLYLGYATVVIVGSWWEARYGRGGSILLGEDEQITVPENGPSTHLSLPQSGEEPAGPDGEEHRGRPQRPHLDVRSALSPPLVPSSGGGTTPSEGGSSLASHFKARPGYIPRHSILSAIEFRDVLQNLRKEATGDHSVELFQSRDPDSFLPTHQSLSRVSSLSRGPRSRRAKSPQSAGPEPARDGNALIEESEDTLEHARRRSNSLSGAFDYFSRRHEQGPEALPDGSASSDVEGNVWSEVAAQTQRKSSFDQTSAPTPAIQIHNRKETAQEKVQRHVKGILKTLFPTLQNLWAKSWLGIFVSFATAPTILCLNLTLPIVDDELEAKIARTEATEAWDGLPPLYLSGEESVLQARPSPPVTTEAAEADGLIPSRQGKLIREEECCDEADSREALIELSKARKLLTAVQCILATPFCVWALSSGDEPNLALRLLISLAFGGGLALICAVIIWRTRKTNPSPWLASTGVLARCFVGFLVAVLWIMTIVDQVILILQALGSIAGVSEAVLGLTIFAAGNSLGDFVANTTMAPLHPVMAISACFAGPLLNLLLGIGLSGTALLSSRENESYHIHFSPTLLVSGVGILTLLLGLLVAVPIQKFHLTKRTGIWLVCGYAGIMTVNLLTVWSGFDHY